MKKIMLTIIMVMMIGINIEAKQIVEAVGHDRACDVYWNLPQYNADSTVCMDLAGVYLFRSVAKSGPYTLVAPTLLPPSRLRWYDDQKINKVTYYYRIKAVDDVGNLSIFSPIAEVMPIGDDVPPTQVEIFVKPLDGPNVEITWTPSVDDKGIDHYNVYRSLTEIKEEYLSNRRKGIPSLVEPVAKVSGNALKFIDKKGKVGTIYYYNVTGVDPSENEGKASNSPYIRIPGKDVTPPMVESVSDDGYKKAQRAGKEITVLLVGESKLNGYYNIGKLAVKTAMKETAKPGTYFGIYTVKKGDDGKEIEVSASLTDAAGLETEKKSNTKITIDTTPPATVKSMTVTTGFESSKIYGLSPKVVVTWDTSEREEGMYYKIYRSEEQISEENIKKATIIAKKITRGKNSYTDLSGIPGKSYYYTVASVDTAENEGLATGIQVKIAGDTYPPKIFKVTEDTYGITQKAGNKIQIVIRGEPGCLGTFDIGPRIKGILMEEAVIGTVKTGTYSGTYTVKEDDDVQSVHIIGHLKDGFSNETTHESETTVTIKTKSTDTTPPEIKSISQNRGGYVIAEGEVIKVTMEGEANCIGFFDIGSMVRGIKLLPTETAGIYEGTYKAEAGDNIGNAVITGYLADDSGNVTTKSCEETATIDTSVKITLRKDPETDYLIADSTTQTGPASVNIIGKVSNVHGEAIAGRKVDFTLISNYGEVKTISNVTDSKGEVQASYQAGLVVQTAYISAEDVETGIAGITYVRTTKSAECIITLKSLQRRFRTFNGQYYIDMEARPERITADGNSVCIVTSTIRKVGTSGVPGPKKNEETETNKNTDERIPGEKVKFNLVSSPEESPGSLRIHPEYRDIEAGGALTDKNGEAKAIYTAGTKIGMAIINALAPLSPDKGQPIAEIIGVVLIAGEVRYLTIVAQPALLDADGKSESVLTVKAEDSFNNPCEDINVNIEIIPATQEAGTIKGEKTGTGQNISTEKNGEATATYIAGTQPGTVKLRATVYSNTPIDDGVVQYDAGNYDKAEEIFKKAIEEYPRENWSDDVYYILGYTEELLRKYKEANESYYEVVRYYFGGPWADNALYRAGQVNEKTGEYAKAIDAYKELIDNAYLLESEEVYKNNLIDNAIFREGVMYERLEHYQKAKECYQELIDRFMNTDEDALIDDAQKALDRLRAQGY